MTPYALQVTRHRRRRRLALSVAPNGTVHARVPYGVSMANIHAFVSAHQDWIMAQQQRVATVQTTALTNTLCAGGWFLYHGQPVPICHQTGVMTCWHDHGYEVDTQTDWVSELKTTLQTKARAMVPLWVDRMSQRVGLVPTKVRLSSARSRWGSCSSSGVVSIYWGLIMAPVSVLEDVITHELCHLKHMNHRPAFWSLLHAHTPTWQASHQWLRSHAHQIQWHGVCQ